MINTFTMPEQSIELAEHIAANPIHHVWKDVPNSKVVVFTGDDMPSAIPNNN